MAIPTTTHFTEKSCAFRAKVRAELRAAGFTSAFRNKRTFGYTDKFYVYKDPLFFQILRKLGVDYKVTNGSGVIVYLPNQE